MTVSRKKGTGPKDSAVTESDLIRQSQELGMFGRIFGSKEQAPVFFAGTIAMVALLGMIVVELFSSSSDKGDFIKSFAAIVLAAVTFLGGVYGGGGNARK